MLGYFFYMLLESLTDDESYHHDHHRLPLSRQPSRVMANPFKRSWILQRTVQQDRSPTRRRRSR